MAARWKALAEKAFSLVDSGRDDRYGEVFAKDCELWFAGTALNGVSAFAELVGMWRLAMPDFRHEITSYVEDGDQIAYEVRVTATHTGPFRMPGAPEIPASGKRVTLAALDHARVRDGKFVRYHVYMDLLGMLQQIGAA